MTMINFYQNSLTLSAQFILQRIRPLLDTLLMSPSRFIQVFHFVSRRVQYKKNIFIFIFIFLTLHLIFYFYFFSEPITISSSFHAPPFYYLVRAYLLFFAIV